MMRQLSVLQPDSGDQLQKNDLNMLVHVCITCRSQCCFCVCIVVKTALMCLSAVYEDSLQATLSA